MSPDELSRNQPVRMHWFGLWFHPVAVERGYRLETVGVQRIQARLALVMGVVLYLLHGLVEVGFNGDHQPFFWVVRALVMAAGLTALVYTFLPSFTRLSQRILTLVSLAPSFGILFMMAFLSGVTFMEYTAGLMLVMTWVFLFIGLSFVRALLINLLVLALFNALFLVGIQPLGEILVRYNFYLVSTLLICGFSAYALERQRRQLYLRRQELESERNRHRERALHDHLTNLPNRYQMEQRLEQAMARARRHGRLGAGLFIDLDRFKPVNDTHGHEAGDRVLRQVAKRLQACVRETDTVARMGGDEFFVLLEDLETSERIHEVALRIIETLSRPFPIDEQDPGSPVVTVGASIGICEFPDMTASPSQVIDHSDRAMYEVKRSGRNGYCFHRTTGPGEVIHPPGAQTARPPMA